MKVFVDLENLRLIDGPGFRSPVSSIRFKRGDAARVDVVFLDNGGTTAVEIGDPELLTIDFGIKSVGRHFDDYIVHSDEWTMPEVGAASPVYSATPSFNTDALNTLLGSGVEGATPVAQIILMGEISWSEAGGAPTSTATFSVVVDNDVNQGSEGTPVELPTPDEWLAGRGWCGLLGVADPEGEVTAVAPCAGMATDGSIWEKTTGSGNTGWRKVAVFNSDGELVAAVLLADQSSQIPAQYLLGRNALGHPIMGDGSSEGGRAFCPTPFAVPYTTAEWAAGTVKRLVSVQLPASQLLSGALTAYEFIYNQLPAGGGKLVLIEEAAPGSRAGDIDSNGCMVFATLGLSMDGKTIVNGVAEVDIQFGPGFEVFAFDDGGTGLKGRAAAATNVAFTGAPASPNLVQALTPSPLYGSGAGFWISAYLIPEPGVEALAADTTVYGSLIAHA